MNDEPVGEEAPPPAPRLPAPAEPGLLQQLARQAMQRMVSTGIVLRRSHPEDFAALQGNEAEVKQVLAELGLSMILKPEYGMAALVRIGTADATDEDEDLSDDDDDEGHRALLRVTRIKFYHSVILSVLRAYYREREVAMDARVIIEIETLKDRLKPYLPLIQSESRSDKQLSGALRLLERHSILLNVRDNKDAREISPVILLAMGATQAQSFEQELDRHLDSLAEATGDCDGA